MTRTPHSIFGFGVTCERSRRGSALVLSTLFLVVLVGLAAFAVDLGHWYTVRGELQNSADAAAIAAAQRLVSDALVQYNPDYDGLAATARTAAQQFAAYNLVERDQPGVDTNEANSTDGDVVIGYLANLSDPSATLDVSNPALYNAVRVRIRKTNEQNGLARAFFSRMWGWDGFAASAQATAMTTSSVIGFKLNEDIGYAKLLPFGLSLDSWNAMLGGNGSDNWRWSEDDQQAYSGSSDGILELNLYPLENLEAGNFGTIDIGSPDNSTADMERQILQGVNAEDLSYFGGEFALGDDGTLQVNGDTGVSTAIRDELTSIIGQPRVVPLYTSVSGNGNNAMYTVVGFAGIRILDVQLTGPLAQRKVTIQPAVVVDESAMIGDTPTQSTYVFSNVRLAR